MEKLLSELKENKALSQQFVEELGERINSNFDLLADDADALVENFAILQELPEGRDFFEILLGVSDLEELAEEFLERCLNSENEEE